MKHDGEMLARLVAQAEGSPVGGDMVMIRALIEEAAELGAGRALERLGLMPCCRGRGSRGWRRRSPR